MEAVDAFWAYVGLYLAELPRPWDVLHRLKPIDPELYKSLVVGERWLEQPERTLAELREGWAWWRRLFLEAMKATEREAAR